MHTLPDNEVMIVVDRVYRRVWRDPVLGDVWVLEILDGHVVGYAGPVHGSDKPPDDLLRFERDPGFLRRIDDQFQRHQEY